MITIEGVRHIAEEFDAFPRVAQAAIVRACNRAIGAGETFMKRAISVDTGLKVGAVAKALRSRPATRANPSATLAASLKRIPLVDFAARGPEPSRGRGRGVTYKLGGASRGRIEYAFIAKVSSGHRGVFLRVARGAGSPRLPIVQAFGPSVGRVFARNRPEGYERAIEAFETTLDHEIARRKVGV